MPPRAPRSLAFWLQKGASQVVKDQIETGCQRQPRDLTGQFIVRSSASSVYAAGLPNGNRSATFFKEKRLQSQVIQYQYLATNKVVSFTGAIPYGGV